MNVITHLSRSGNPNLYEKNFTYKSKKISDNTDFRKNFSRINFYFAFWWNITSWFLEACSVLLLGLLSTSFLGHPAWKSSRGSIYSGLIFLTAVSENQLWQSLTSFQIGFCYLFQTDCGCSPTFVWCFTSGKTRSLFKIYSGLVLSQL